jgi:hypothetical protein
VEPRALEDTAAKLVYRVELLLGSLVDMVQCEFVVGYRQSWREPSLLSGWPVSK